MKSQSKLNLYRFTFLERAALFNIKSEWIWKHLNEIEISFIFSALGSTIMQLALQNVNQRVMDAAKNQQKKRYFSLLQCKRVQKSFVCNNGRLNLYSVSIKSFSNKNSKRKKLNEQKTSSSGTMNER